MGNSASIAPERGGAVVSSSSSGKTSSSTNTSATTKGDKRQCSTTKATERNECSAQNLKYAVSGMKGWRPTMEDQHLYSNTIVVETKTRTGENGDRDGSEEKNGNDDDNDAVVVLSDHSLFAVFDGHGGGFTSHYLKTHFLRVLGARPEMRQYAALSPSSSGGNSSGSSGGSRGGGRTDGHGVKLLRDALCATFVDIDQELRLIHEQHIQNTTTTQTERFGSTGSFFDSAAMFTDVVTSTLSSLSTTTTTLASSSPVDRCGSTAVVVVVTPSHLLCANVGDSRAVVRRRAGPTTLPLSFDHKPHHIFEGKRITAAGGTVRHQRIDGDLAVSRALGDFSLKANVQLPAHQQKVIANPDCIVYRRQALNDEYIILACDGVWDVASNDQCTRFVSSFLSHGEDDFGHICEAALDQCLERKSRDNMTLMLVGFSAANNNSLPPLLPPSVQTTGATRSVPSRAALPRGRAGVVIAAEGTDGAATRLTMHTAYSPKPAVYAV